ncbi:MAG TPA: response regulator, partial [Rheinheimera sp.]|nr:response regulator [Rheinheimera sp.]
IAKECSESVTEKVGLLISDIEMPEMDGYTLTAEIKQDAKLKRLHVILHTSLSGVFNQQMVQKVGADDFIAKFNPDELAESVQKWLHAD